MARAVVVVLVFATALARAEGPAAYLAHHDRGLLRVEGRRLVRVTREPRHAVDVRAAPDGSFYVLDGLVPWRVDAGGAAIVGPGLALYMDVAPSGKIWLGNEAMVATFADGDWHTRELADAPKTWGIRELAVDAAGDAWVRNHNGLFRTAGAGWTRVITPQPDVAHCKLGRGPRIVLACWEQVWRWDGAAWRSLAALPRLAVNHVVVDEAGWITLDAFSEGKFQIVILPPDGGPPRIAQRGNAETFALEVDAKGRAWLASWRGVEVYDRDAKPIAPKWLRSAGDVRGLLIVGDGPKL